MEAGGARGKAVYRNARVWARCLIYCRVQCGYSTSNAYCREFKVRTTFVRDPELPRLVKAGRDRAVVVVGAVVLYAGYCWSI